MNWKKIAIVAAIVLVGYFIINDPIAASNTVDGGLGNVEDAANSVTTFLGNVFQ